jgi:hypothetical protein
MTLDKASAAAGLDGNVDSIRSYLSDDDDLVQRYREAVREVPIEWTREDIEEELSGTPYPGALPSDSFDGADSLIRRHSESDGWESHEAVNDWARGVLDGVPVLAADGSEIPPTTQFNVPVAFVQAAWCLNHHTADGRLERGLVGRLLAPDEVSRDDGDYRYVDATLVGHHRYEHEAEVVVDRIRELAADREAGELERPPVVLYDGPLVVSFANSLPPEARDRYTRSVSRLIAASEHHEVPVVGYVAGSNAADLVKMVRLVLPDRFSEDRIVPDSRVLAGLMGAWGDTTLPMLCRREGGVDMLEGMYEGTNYSYDRDLLFAYLNAPPGAGLDRLEFPGWLTRTDGPEGFATLYEYVLSVVRAEAAVGRGYPEVMQQADADAVLDQGDREDFLQLVQRWAEENDVPLEWNQKARSKELRRR